MRLARVGTWVAALLLTLAVSATLAADTKSDGKGSGSGTPESLSKEMIKPDQDGPSRASEDLAARYHRERGIYLRRLAVCAELKEIASRNNDLELERKIEQLEERAFAVYNLRTGNPLPPASFNVDGEDKTVERHSETSNVPLSDVGDSSSKRSAGEDRR